MIRDGVVPELTGSLPPRYPRRRTGAGNDDSGTGLGRSLAARSTGVSCVLADTATGLGGFPTHDVGTAIARVWTLLQQMLSSVGIGRLGRILA